MMNIDRLLRFSSHHAISSLTRGKVSRDAQRKMFGLECDFYPDPTAPMRAVFIA
jgi:hypothetical protein